MSGLSHRNVEGVLSCDREAVSEVPQRFGLDSWHLRHAVAPQVAQPPKSLTPLT